MSNGRTRPKNSRCIVCGKPTRGKYCVDCWQARPKPGAGRPLKAGRFKTADGKIKKHCPYCGNPIAIRSRRCRQCANENIGDYDYEKPRNKLPPMRVMLNAGHSIFDEPPHYAKPSEGSGDD